MFLSGTQVDGDFIFRSGDTYPILALFNLLVTIGNMPGKWNFEVIYDITLTLKSHTLPILVNIQKCRFNK